VTEDTKIFQGVDSSEFECDFHIKDIDEPLKKQMLDDYEFCNTIGKVMTFQEYYKIQQELKSKAEKWDNLPTIRHEDTAKIEKLEQEIKELKETLNDCANEGAKYIIEGSKNKEIVQMVRERLAYWKHELECEINMDKEVSNQMAVQDAEQMVKELKEILKEKS